MIVIDTLGLSCLRVDSVGGTKGRCLSYYCRRMQRAELRGASLAALQPCQALNIPGL